MGIVTLDSDDHGATDMLNKEPAIFFGGIGEIAKAVIPVLVIGGFVGWDEKMVAAMMFLVSVSVTSLSTMFTRQQSVATAVANKQIEFATTQPAGTSAEKVIELSKGTGDGK